MSFLNMVCLTGPWHYRTVQYRTIVTICKVTLRFRPMIDPGLLTGWEGLLLQGGYKLEVDLELILKQIQ
jgi:hypothetical protein